MTFGEYIATQRRALELTLADIADEMGVNVSTVMRYESNEFYPDYDGIFVLTNVLSLDFNVLCAYAGKYPPDLCKMILDNENGKPVLTVRFHRR